MRRSRWYYPLAIAALALLIWWVYDALSGVAQTGMQRAALPEGWMLIRPPHETAALALDGAQVLAGGRDGLVAIDQDTGALLGPPPDAPGLRYVRDLLLDTRGRLWVAHARGVTVREGGRWQDCPAVRDLVPGPATALCEDARGRIWVGGAAQGVGVLDAGSRRPPEGDPPPLAEVEAILATRDGSIWIGMGGPTGGGLARLRGGSWRVYTTQDGLPHNSVRDLIEDRSGGIWVATGFSSRGGVARLRDGRWTALTSDDGLPEGSMRSVFEDRDGRIWLGSEYYGMVILDGEQVITLTPREGLAGWETKEIVQEASGRLWLGTEDGITRIEQPPGRLPGAAAGGAG